MRPLREAVRSVLAGAMEMSIRWFGIRCEKCANQLPVLNAYRKRMREKTEISVLEDSS